MEGYQRSFISASIAIRTMDYFYFNQPNQIRLPDRMPSDCCALGFQLSAHSWLEATASLQMNSVCRQLTTSLL